MRDRAIRDARYEELHVEWLDISGSPEEILTSVQRIGDRVIDLCASVGTAAVAMET